MKYIALFIALALATFSASAEPLKVKPLRGIRNIASAIAKQERSGEQWLTGKVGLIVSSLTGIDDNPSKGFSVNGCRIPNQKLIELSTGLIKGYTHEFKWDKECDLDGKLNLVLNEPFGFDLRVRNMNEVQRIKGLASMQLGRINGSFQNMKQVLKVEQGSVHLKSAIPVAKFNATHVRQVAYLPQSSSLITKKNKGMVLLKEFRRSPSSYKSYFSIKNSHIDK